MDGGGGGRLRESCADRFIDTPEHIVSSLHSWVGTRASAAHVTVKAQTALGPQGRRSAPSVKQARGIGGPAYLAKTLHWPQGKRKVMVCIVGVVAH